MNIQKSNILIYLVLMLFLSCKETKDLKLQHDKNIPKSFAPYLDSLEMDFQNQYKKGQLPGFALAIFTSKEIIFQNGYGFANVEAKKKMNVHTIQGIASITKTLIAVSLMKAIEMGKMSLDDKINDILPFKVINPNYENVPITIRQLATHTSSINDDGNYDKSYLFEEKLDKEKFPSAWHKYLDIYNENQTMEMEVFLERVFRVGGDWETEKNFTTVQPGSEYDYSNIGAALLAYCIQLSVGKNYKEFTRDLILDKLEMDNSGW